MAKLFANLDRLRESPTPNIVSAAKPINYNAQSQKIKSSFANNISLTDRLKQSSLNTTNHLPEFFLSDTYTGFLQIKPLGTYEHKSLTVVKQPVSAVAQGETNSTQAVSSVAGRQGIVVVNNIESSVTSVNYTIPSVNQGIVESNNVQSSITNVQSPSITVSQGIIDTNNKQVSIIDVVQPVTALNQGSIDITQPNPIINQGVGTTPITPIQDVKGLQGISLTDTTGIVVVPTKGADNYLTFVDVVDIKKIKLGSAKALEQRESTKAAAIPSLHILKYEGDRLLARLTPTVKHGSTITLGQPTNTVKQSDQANIPGSNTNMLEMVNGVKQFAPVGPTKEIVTELGNTFASEDNNPTFDAYITLPKVPTGYTRINKSNQLENPKNWKLISYSEGKLQESDISDYRTLTQLVKEKKNNQTHYTGGETVIKIARVTGGGEVVSFTAFITSLSDTTSPTYQDNQPVGRQDITKTFKGVTRQVSLGFKAIALGTENNPAWSVSDDFNSSKQNALQLVRKVNKLQRIAGIGTVQADAAYTIGPTLAITIAGLYKNVICTANSIKVDVPIADTPWESTTTPLPMYYDISMDFSILTANDGQAFNSNQTFIGY